MPPQYSPDEMVYWVSTKKGANQLILNWKVALSAIVWGASSTITLQWDTVRKLLAADVPAVSHLVTQSAFLSGLILPQKPNRRYECECEWKISWEMRCVCVFGLRMGFARELFVFSSHRGNSIRVASPKILWHSSTGDVSLANISTLTSWDVLFPPPGHHQNYEGYIPFSSLLFSCLVCTGRKNIIIYATAIIANRATSVFKSAQLASNPSVLPL